MTRGAVRCSAWLGVRSDLRQRRRVAAKRCVKVTAALRAAARGRLCRWADGNAPKCGWGVGRKLPGKRTDERVGDVERGCAADSESEAQTGITPLIAARVAAWPKPGNAKLSKLVRHAARADALASPLGARTTSDLEPLELLVTLASELVMEGYVLGRGARTPNDLKLSDGGGWRGSCAVGERRRQEAGAVTAVAVRCSAWLGDG